MKLFITESETLEVRLHGRERMLAAKSRLEIPTHLVVGAEAVDRKAIPRCEGTWLEAPGTHIPGLLRYGSYGRVPHREFWAVRGQRRVLVITIRDWDYARVILTIDDPETWVASLFGGRREQQRSK